MTEEEKMLKDKEKRKGMAEENKREIKKKT